MTTPVPSTNNTARDLQVATGLVQFGDQLLNWNNAQDRREIQMRAAQMQANIDRLHQAEAAGDREAGVQLGTLIAVYRAMQNQILAAQQGPVVSSEPPPPASNVGLIVAGVTATALVGAVGVMVWLLVRQSPVADRHAGLPQYARAASTPQKSRSRGR